MWFDTETDQEQVDHNTVRHVLRFGWAAYRRRLSSGEWSAPSWCHFTTAAQLWDWIESLLHGRMRLYLFAHNQGFDLPVVDAFSELHRRGFALGKAVIDCPPVLLKWRRAAASIEALDTLNIWRVPLSQLGTKVGLRKLKMPAPGASERRWLAYGRRDVKVIMAACLAWFAFLQTQRLGGFAPTLASQAMRAYRHRFMHVDLLTDADDNALELARESYVGGRVECYRLGRVEGPIYRLDVNSMYPYVMRDSLMPVKLISTTRRSDHADLRAWLSRYCVTAKVDIFTDAPVYPVVHQGRLVFPLNRFTTTLCTPELRYALECGHVERVHHVAVHEGAVIFGEFVSELWELRRAAARAGDKLLEWLLKIFQNSLYGKFGQRGRVYRDAGQVEHTDARAWLELDADTGTTYKHRTLGGLHQVFADDAESFNSMPAIAAHVCAYARLYLWQLQLTAGRENVLYCDTDSLATTEAGYMELAALVNPEQLGALKLEGVESWGIYRGPKDYQYPTYSKTKGVRAAAHWIAPDTVVQQQWSSLVGLVRAGAVSAPTTRAIVKTLQRHYLKGLVTSRGKVLPLSLG
ncbi:MAG TPA: DNA polymerase [Gammaproteobacteria bacterium]|nr:DNA polymerase [Gammaproteobacteria bacterium]